MRSLNRGALVGLAAALLTSGLLLVDETFFGLEHPVTDAFSRRQARSLPVDQRILLVTVNNSTITTLGQAGFGRWPYDRELMARVIEEAKLGGARAIAFDISFTAPNVGGEEGDAHFAEALADSPSILGVHTAVPTRGSVKPDTTRFRHLLWSKSGDTRRGRFRLLPPFNDFVPASGIGTMRFEESRRYVTLDCLESGECVPSLALATAREILGAPRSAMIREKEVRVGSLRIPVDRDGRMLIRWRGAKKRADELSYPVLDFHKVVMASAIREAPELNPAEAEKLPQFSAKFKDKIVIVAATAQGTFEVRPTPLSPIAPGVEIHANALDNMLNGDFHRAAPVALVLFATILATTLLGVFLVDARTQVSAFSVFLGISGMWLLAAYIAQSQRWIMQSVAPLTALLLTYGTVTVIEYVREQRRGVQLRATFGRYVSPQVLEHILSNPDQVELGGIRRNMTILFSDIRGFTSISEATEPEDVVEMLNEYLTDMVEILLRHGGTLDKFIGDAVMGFWNAPTDDPDHAQHGVDCAIEMVERTAALREKWEAEGRPAIRIGIGLNSGDAVVGNIGAKQVFSYTVIGDTVNLASRLESKNKDYATEIIVSEMTLSRIPADRYDVKYLDEVKVKGKAQAVKIYEIRGKLP